MGFQWFSRAASPNIDSAEQKSWPDRRTFILVELLPYPVTHSPTIYDTTLGQRGIRPGIALSYGCQLNGFFFLGV